MLVKNRFNDGGFGNTRQVLKDGTKVGLPLGYHASNHNLSHKKAQCV